MQGRGPFLLVATALFRRVAAVPQSFLGLHAESRDRGLVREDLDSSPPRANGAVAVDGPFAQLRLAPGVDLAGATSLGAAPDGAGGFLLVPLPTAGTEASEPLAWGSFADTLPQLGWSSLTVHTSAVEGVAEGSKMYAAGAIEGYLTAQRIREFHDNSRILLDMNPENKQRLPALKQALATLVTALAGAADLKAQPQSAFDAQARLGLLQTWGIRDGYQLALASLPALAGEKPLSMVDMFILNSDGVIDELLSKYGADAEGVALLQRRSAGHRAARQRRQRRGPAGHCTGLVRLAEDRSELYFGHTTWEGFSEMTRVWKVYDFPLQGVAAKKISFSSYPGCISSTDDYYLMDSGLAVTETTLNIPLQQDYPTGAAVPDFIRIMVANRLSRSADEWVHAMTDSATGTYSSQWLVLDYKKFSPGADLPNSTFYVLEQAPGISHFQDMTDVLQKDGYWASFDRAFFDDVRARTGDADMEKYSLEDADQAEAETYSKDRTPRAQIIRQTARTVNSLSQMRAELTRNRGTEEPVDQPTLRQPRYAISARDDLKDSDHIDPDGSPDGGVDAKVTSYCLFQDLVAEAVSSPSHDNLPPFRWTGATGSELWPGYPHEGLPNVANFDWVRAGPPGRDGPKVAAVGPLPGKGHCQ